MASVATVHEDKLDPYWIGAWITGGLTFVGCWIYAIAEWGWFLGIAFGWIPSAIIGVIVGVLWGVLLSLLALAIVALILLGK